MSDDNYPDGANPETQEGEGVEEITLLHTYSSLWIVAGAVAIICVVVLAVRFLFPRLFR